MVEKMPTKKEDQPVVKHGEEASFKEMLEEKKPEKPEFEFEKLELKEEKFDFQESLKDEDFFDYLTQYAPDNVEALDKSEIEKYFEAYKTSKEIKYFYQDIIEKDTGLKLEDKDLKALDSYFATQKDIDSKYVVEVRNYAREFRALPEVIAEKEKKFAELGGKETLSRARVAAAEGGLKIENLGMALGQMEKKRELRKELGQFFNIKGWLLELGIDWLANKEEAEAYRKSVDLWRKEAADLNAEINRLVEETKKSREAAETLAKLEEETQNLKEQSDALKNFFLGGYFEPAKGVLDTAKAKLRERIKEIADPKKSLEEIEKGFEITEKLSGAKLVELSKEELKDFEKQVETAVENKVSSEIIEKLQKLPISKAGLLETIKKFISSYFQKEKIGKKTKREEVEELIMKTLNNYLKQAKPSEGETPQSFKAKKIAIKCLILQMGYAA